LDGESPCHQAPAAWDFDRIRPGLRRFSLCQSKICFAAGVSGPVPSARSLACCLSGARAGVAVGRVGAAFWYDGRLPHNYAVRRSEGLAAELMMVLDE